MMFSSSGHTKKCPYETSETELDSIDDWLTRGSKPPGAYAGEALSIRAQATEVRVDRSGIVTSINVVGGASQHSPR